MTVRMNLGNKQISQMSGTDCAAQTVNTLFMQVNRITTHYKTVAFIQVEHVFLNPKIGFLRKEETWRSGFQIGYNTHAVDTKKGRTQLHALLFCHTQIVCLKASITSQSRIRQMKLQAGSQSKYLQLHQLSYNILQQVSRLHHLLVTNQMYRCLQFRHQLVHRCCY